MIEEEVRDRVQRKISAQQLWSGFEGYHGTEARVLHAPTNTARTEQPGPGNAPPNSFKDKGMPSRDSEAIYALERLLQELRS